MWEDLDEKQTFEIKDNYVKNLNKIVIIADNLDTQEPAPFSGSVDENEYNHRLIVICFNFLNT